MRPHRRGRATEWIHRAGVPAGGDRDVPRRGAPTAGRTRVALAAALVSLSALALALAVAASAPARPSARGALHTAGAGAASLSERAVCRRLRADSGRLAPGGTRRRLTVLATGDSMIYPIDEELSIGRPRGMRVVTDRRDGTGLTTNTVDWRALSRRQAADIRPDATVISLGGRDGGIPLRDSNHRLVDCCGREWLELYAGLLRPLVRAYLRGGRSHVYWLLLPAPRERARAPLFEAVNDSLRLLAAEFGPALKPIPTDTVISPGGFQETIVYRGLEIHPRAPDGIHLTHAGACVERSLVVESMLADGLLRRTTGH